MEIDILVRRYSSEKQYSSFVCLYETEMIAFHLSMPFIWTPNLGYFNVRYAFAFQKETSSSK